MSADSPRRSLHKGAQIVSPQPIVDRSIIDSVAGIINDIVPQAYAGVPNADNKESIAWARFEYADINDPTLYPDYNEGSSTPPLLLVLGYTTGVQVWLIAATGEASEVLSWRQGVVRTLRILPNPKTDEEHSDPFEPKRPMVAICDSAGPGPQYLCNISFISLKTGEQTKTIKFKNPVCDILANRRSVVVAFFEKIAVFDARTLEDILTVTSCYASPGPNPNPIALGTRWLAYSEKKLLPTRRSSGGCEGEGVQSYTATVLYAAKSLGKGLRGLGETVASSLTGNSVSPVAINNMGNDVTQPGIVSILDLQAAKDEKELDNTNMDTLIAHFTAHTDAIVAMTFDLTGALLMTADRRGHDFHVFRIQPHPGGPTLAAVHHLYVLHRGDTTAKVQDMTFSSDTRWAAISTVRGTTHVFPVAPYGGPIGVRTHSTPQVVNRLSRFHRSAGLTDDGTRSHSPVSHAELPLSVYPYSNPRLPPYPHPTILHPLAQIPQPSSLNHVTSQSQTSRPQQQRQRLHSDDSGGLPLKICACFAPPRAWIYAQRESGSKVAKRAVDSLFIMACHGNMIQYDLEPKPAAGVAKEKVCDDTTIELEVEARGQWPLLRSPNSVEIMPPLPLSSPLLTVTSIPTNVEQLDTAEDRWLSQVEIVTHAGPHRRLWMGPQFVFKTYNAPSGVAVNLVEAEAVEIGVSGGSRPARSNPVNMPHAASRPLVPVVIDGSGSSYEQSPRFMEAYGDPLDGESMRIGSGENQLREDLAEAMLETSIAPNRAPGRRSVFERVGQPVTKVVNPLGTVITVSADEEDVSSSQEFDSAEEGLVPEPPRSVCAEEGPASLGDLEPESQTLRDLTEICAEMRAANEPAIDSVPDENIREIKERRALCAEIAVATKSSSIDFEREEAFQDVPTSLSLCAEEGEVPSSPMTQAKETAWCRRSGRQDDVVTHERNFAKAKYVVNYDEDCVVLMENRALNDRRRALRLPDEPVGARTIGEQACEQADNVATHLDKPTKKPCKSFDRTSESTSKPRIANESKARVEKYVVRENEDSIVIEDVTRPKESKASRSKKKATGALNVELVDDNVQTKCAKKSKLLKDAEVDKGTGKSIDAFVDLEALEVPSCANASTQLLEDYSCKDEEVLAEATLLEQSPRSEADANRLDDLRALEYNTVEEDCLTKDSGSQNQSDEEIEHVQRSDVAQTRGSESGGTKVKCCLGEFSPIAQRKGSKSTISDDDLEYINSSELAETLERVAATKLASSDKPEENSSVRRHSKHALSSDDDLEHIHHSDICELSGDATSVTTDLPERSATSSKKSQSLGTTEQTTKSRNTKKQQHSKDLVVIESGASEAEVTLVVKSLENWVHSKTPEEDPIEEMVKCVDIKAHALDQDSSSPPSSSKSKPPRGTKTSSSVSTLSKRSQSGTVEIIDIDAMQKAEMEIGTEGSPMPSTPECKILSPRHEARSSRRSRRNKKSQVEPGAQDLGSVDSAQTTKPQTDAQFPEDSTNESVGQEKIEISWSSIVKKSPSAPLTGGASMEAENPRRECDLEPLIEVEERVESQEAKVRLAEARVMERAEEACCEPPSDSLERAVDPRERKALRRNVEESTRIVEGTFERRKLTTKGSESAVERTEDTQRMELQARTHDGGGKGSRPPLVPVSKSSQAAASTVKARPSDEAKASQEDFPTAPPPSSSSPPPPPGSSSSKENSPVPEAEAPKRRDSKQETVPERSSTSDELNANVLPMDTEEDCCLAREIVERSVNNPSASLIIGTTKKGGRFKRKKHR